VNDERIPNNIMKNNPKGRKCFVSPMGRWLYSSPETDKQRHKRERERK
jgi:hypothetical protein